MEMATGHLQKSGHDQLHGLNLLSKMTKVNK
jgi:hypothetical protein